MRKVRTITTDTMRLEMYTNGTWSKIRHIDMNSGHEVIVASGDGDLSDSWDRQVAADKAAS